MTLPVVVPPNPYQAVLPYLQTFLDAQADAYVTGTTVGDKLVSSPGRYVMVRRVGGRVNGVVLDNVRLDFMVWHNGSNGNRVDLANLVRAAVLAMNGTYSSIQVYGVTEFMGPADMPDPQDSNTTITMFTLTASMRGTELPA